MNVSTQRRRQTDDPTSGQADDAAAFVGMDIATLCEALQDDVAIIDRQQARVLWCSSSFAAHFPAVCSGVSWATVCRLFEGLAACGSGVKANALASEKLQRTTVRYEGNKPFAASVVPLDETRAVLRIKNSVEHERVMQRHLEDREKLLFTSRAISVSEMATTLAHELNQPIGTISNLLRGIRLRLRRGEGATPEIAGALDSAIDQTLFAAKIITRVRDYTQSFQPRRTRVDLAVLVRASMALLDWEMQREGITVVDPVTEEGESLVVMGDEVMLQQVFVNLLRNAIDAMRGLTKDSKCIAVSAQYSEGQVEVSITDSGCGLSSEAEANLFVPFVSTKPNGMGVGYLSLVRRITSRSTLDVE